MPKQILWLVDDYVKKTELPEWLLPIIERAKEHRRSHHIPPDESGAGMRQHKYCYAPFS
jgi:hypothetical protein